VSGSPGARTVEPMDTPTLPCDTSRAPHERTAIPSRVTDSRRTPLATIAREQQPAVSRSLEQVLPGNAGKRVAVAAFTSSL